MKRIEFSGPLGYKAAHELHVASFFRRGRGSPWVMGDGGGGGREGAWVGGGGGGRVASGGGGRSGDAGGKRMLWK